LSLVVQKYMYISGSSTADRSPYRPPHECSPANPQVMYNSSKGTSRKGGLMKKVLSLLCAGMTLCSVPLMSQEISAGITGRVTDPSNSAIVGATVVAKDLDRGTEWPTKTNQDG